MGKSETPPCSLVVPTRVVLVLSHPRKNTPVLSISSTCKTAEVTSSLPDLPTSSSSAKVSNLGSAFLVLRVSNTPSLKSVKCLKNLRKTPRKRSNFPQKKKKKKKKKS